MMRSLIVTREPYRVSSYWLGGFVSIVCPLPRHWRFASALSSPHRSTALSSCPPTNIRFRFFDVSASASKDFLSHCKLHLGRITVYTAKKRVLFGPRDVDCDSAHAATSLSLPVDAFVMVGSMWHSTSPFPHRYFFPQKTHWGWVAGVCQVLNPLSWPDWVKVLLRRSVYSNSSTGL